MNIPPLCLGTIASGSSAAPAPKDSPKDSDLARGGSYSPPPREDPAGVITPRGLLPGP